MKKKFEIISLTLLLLISVDSAAQSFKYRWRLDTVAETGFFRIPIVPTINQHLKVDLADLRIVDGSNKNVPHIVQTAGLNWSEQLFREFPILSDTLTDSSRSVLILSNPTNEIVTQLKLFVRNNSVSRTVSLSGSNDQKSWYIIDDKLQLNRSYESIKDQYLQELAFPGSNYKFFKLVVDNLNNDPVSIVKAGAYLNVEFKSVNPYYSISKPIIKQIDSSKFTKLAINWPYPVQVDRIRLEVTAPALFNRMLRLYLPNQKNGTVVEDAELLGSFTIRSGTVGWIEFPRIKTASLFCWIENGDNPALEIKAALAEQLSVSAIAYLEKGKGYSLLLDNVEASAPDYDLSAFKDSIRSKLIGSLSTSGSIEQITSAENEEKESGNNRWWIWPAIGLLIVSLGMLTYRLVLDMKKRES